MSKMTPDRLKTIGLLTAIILIFSFLGVNVVPQLMHGTVAAPQIASPPAKPTALPPATAPATTPAIAADPFWRPLALSSRAASTNPGPTTLAPPKTDAAPGTSAVPGTLPAAPFLLPDAELQGIVRDETAMAVVRIGDKVRYLREGESLGGGWVLFRIQSSEVLLRNGKQELVLTLGQSLQKETLSAEKGAGGASDAVSPPRTTTLKK